MKAIYDIEANTLTEVSEIDKPTQPLRHNFESDAEHLKAYSIYGIDLRQHYAHIASLRAIPCDPSCRDKFVHGKEYEEGKDFEIKECRNWTKREKDGWGCAECCNRDRCDEDCDATYYRPKCPFCKGKGWFKEQPLFAFLIKEESPAVPLSATVQEDAWTELLTDLSYVETDYQNDCHSVSHKYAREERAKALNEIKKRFSITKKPLIP